MSAAVKRMQMALANLRLWMALVGTDERPSIHPERVIEAIGALEAGLAEIGGEEPAETAEGEEPAPVVMDEQELPAVDEDAMISLIQEQVMKQGVALPADVIAMVLEAEEDFLYDYGVIAVDFTPEEDEEAEDEEP